MMILALVRNYIPSHEIVKGGGWHIADCVYRAYDVEGMNIGTVAAGRIGLAVLKSIFSNGTSKRRKVATDNNSNSNGDETTSSVAGVEDMIAEMKVHMSQMQHEMNSMRGRLLQMDELEGKATATQSEINGMKGRLLQMDELEKSANALKAEENKFLKTKCSSLERAVNILVKEQKWEYLAPDIPRSHWVERGFDDGYISSMEGFLTQIKRATCTLRNDRGCINVLGDPDSETALLHDDLLLPHWQEFANAMQLYQEEPFELSIYNLQLSASVINLLKPVLQHKPIVCIDLHNNSFVNVREGVEFAVDVMASNEVLQTFYWTNNTINSLEDARHLVKAIINHPIIDSIRLDGCFGEEVNENDVLRSLLTGSKNFASIDLDNNSIKSDGVTAISDYLAINPPLKELYLRNNNLNDEDAVLISSALRTKNTLHNLLLDENNITKIGAKALSTAIYDPINLNSVADCNHTCCIDGIDVWDIPVNFHEFTSNDNRRQKIYRLLSTRNREGSNVYHLNLEFGDEEEDSLALVPKVLECVHRYGDYPRAYRRARWNVPQLSITYEILRGWKMPELYENCGGG